MRYLFAKRSDLASNGLLNISKLPEEVIYRGVVEKIDGFVVYEEAAEVTGFSAPIPEHVNNFELRKCRKFEILEATHLPKTIKSVALLESGIKEIKGVVAEGLEKITIEECLDFKVLNASQLPSSLRYLILKRSGIAEIEGNFAEGIEEISLEECKNFRTLNAASLPKTLRKLKLNNSGLTEIVGKFVEGVEEIDLSGCENLKTLQADNLPISLRKLDLDGSGIERIEGIFPPILEEMSFLNCNKLKFVNANQLPKTLKRVTFRATELERIEGNFHEGLEEINFIYCKKIKVLDAKKLPRSLKKLEIGTLSIEKIEGDLPKGLEELNGRFREINLSQLPSSLKKLDLKADNITEFDGDFFVLEELRLRGCKNLKVFNGAKLTALKELDLGETAIEEVGKLPASLKELSLSGCASLRVLQAENLPQLEKIDLKSSAIEKIEGRFAEGLKQINLNKCANLKVLDFSCFPQSLETIFVGESGIEEITGDFPANLKGLDLSKCTKLLHSKELVAKLAELERGDCVVKYPRNFLRNQAKMLQNKLDVIIAAKTNEDKIDENSFDKVKDLFLRLLTENIASRGGIKEVVGAIQPVIEYIESNPGALLWINEIAKNSPTASINQPALVLTKISAWIDVAEKLGFEGKLEKTKIVLAQDSMELHFTKLPQEQKPGRHVAVEAQNALLREVHKKLLENGDIDEAWFGVPQALTYEVAIESWLTTARIDEFYQIAKNSMQISREKLADNLCETNHCEVWGAILFNKEIKELLEERKSLETVKTTNCQNDEEKKALGEEISHERKAAVNKMVAKKTMSNFEKRDGFETLGGEINPKSFSQLQKDKSLSQAISF